MNTYLNEFEAPQQWKIPVIIILKLAASFAVISFFVGYFMYHPPANWLIPTCILAVSYLVCLIAGITHMVKNLPAPILMIMIPIAPLFILLYSISLAAFLQRFT